MILLGTRDFYCINNKNLSVFRIKRKYKIYFMLYNESEIKEI
jgi:hypothetical protein